jgi:hypothetical protein
VQDGTIWRTRTYVQIAVAPKLLDKDDYGYLLLVDAKSLQALRRSQSGGWVLGGEDLPPEYPYYKVGSPSGCEGCVDAEITYSTRTPQVEIVRLTSFDFSCLTRLISCKEPEDLMPAARQENHYNYPDPNLHDDLIPPPSREFCNGLLWAEARDTGTVLIVDTISVSERKGYYGPYAMAKVRAVSYLKGTVRWPVGSILNVSAEGMVPGKGYVVLPSEDPYGKPVRYEDESEIDPVRCGVQEDTPENRRELEKGFAQNDNLRGPELR